MKALICGGREFNDAAFIRAELDRLYEQYLFNAVIEGDARVSIALLANGRA